jgi:hypothetical protein
MKSICGVRLHSRLVRALLPGSNVDISMLRIEFQEAEDSIKYIRALE